MKTLLAASLLAPVLALAQTQPSSPPPPPRERPGPLRAGMPQPGAARSGAPPAPGAAPQAPSQPRPRAEGAAAAVPDSKCVPLQGRFLLAFNKADIVDVLEQASRWTCRNFAYTDETARGKITLLSKTPVTAEEAYAAFLTALNANGIAVYPSGKYYKLVRIADAKKVPIPTILEEGVEAPALEQPVTKVLRLHYVDADQLRGVLGNFTSPQGADIQSIPPDVLVITDIGLNIRRIERIVEAIDRPGSGDLIRVIQVQYAPAREVADKVNQVFAQQPPGPGRPSRRTLIGGVTPGPATAAGVPPAPQAGGAPTEISISKVLADERTNKLIVLADDKSYQRILELVKQLDVPTSGEGTIHVVFLKNANAEELAQTLQALAQGQASARRPGRGGAPAVPTGPGVQPVPPAGGPTPSATADLFAGEVKITADKPSNSLVVLASASDFATITRLIEKLDRPRRQVFVEAVIMEVDLNNEKQFGVGMHAVIPYKTADGTGFIPLGFEPGRVNSITMSGASGLISFAGLGGLLTGLMAPVSADLKDVLPPGVSSLGVLIQALQTSSDVNVLSTPHILASDNEESEITVGQNVPFQAGYAPSGLGSVLGASATGSASSAAGTVLGLQGLNSLYAPIQRQNVELKLKIKPQISEGDTVRLDLEEQTEEIASKDPVLGPTTAKRSVKTKIVAKDQNTVVIGGLIQDRTVQSVHKIPVLGDIPVLGWLFRDTITTKTKTNLLLFLTPYIIRDQSDYRRILDRKRKEQQEFAEAFYGRQPGYEVAVDYARKPGPYARIRRDIATESQKVENGGPGAPGERVIRPPQERPSPTEGESPPSPGALPAQPPTGAAPAPGPRPESERPVAPAGQPPPQAEPQAPPPESPAPEPERLAPQPPAQ